MLANHRTRYLLCIYEWLNFMHEQKIIPFPSLHKALTWIQSGSVRLFWSPDLCFEMRQPKPVNMFLLLLCCFPDFFSLSIENVKQENMIRYLIFEVWKWKVEIVWGKQSLIMQQRHLNDIDALLVVIYRTLICQILIITAFFSIGEVSSVCFNVFTIS